MVPLIPLSEIFMDDPVRMIRAVKYAALTGFSLPMNLKLKIKKQSKLLASVSPSRLTEEIFKIIHSNKAALIVDMLDKIGLYSYLQPEAVKLMRKNKDYRERYLKTLSALNGKENYRGYILGSLFYDYLESIGEWKPGVIENYREIFQIARSFVLPMNPPRYEMEHALRSFLSARGITIKRIYPHERPKPPAEGESAPSPSKKRRRRRKPKLKPNPDATQ